MTIDSLAPFDWLRGQGNPLGEIYCVAFVRGLDPAEVLRRYGADEGKETSFAELDHEVGELVMVTEGGDGGGHVGVAAAGDWSVAIEPWGWSAVLDPLLSRLSVGSEVVAVSRHDYACDHFAYAVDGVEVTSFHPEEPDERHGADPDRLSDLMREFGLDPDRLDDEREAGLDDDEGQAGPDDSSSTGLYGAFALAARLTGVTFSADLLAGPLLVGATMPYPAPRPARPQVRLQDLLDSRGG